jgi:Sugar-transfer associated ATP-grasp
MNQSLVRWSMPAALATIAAIATIATFVDLRFVGAILDSSTGVFGLLCALVAISRLARGALGAIACAGWLALLAVAVVVACTEFAEPFSELKGHNFGIDNVDDVLLLAAAPIGLWLTSRMELRPGAVQLLLVIGLAAQLAGAVLDLSNAQRIDLDLTARRVEDYADFAQFLSLMCYFMAMWLLVRSGAQRRADEAPARTAASAVSPYGPGLRDTLYPPPFLIGWGLADPRSPAGRVHRLCNKALWPAADIVLTVRNLATIALWPIVASARALQALRKHGSAVQHITGKSRLRQFAEQVSIAVRYRIAPSYYYTYEFYRPGQPLLAPRYLMRYETKEIAYRLLYPVATADYEPTPLKNKMAFARHCRANGVRHVDVFMLFENGEQVDTADLINCLPEADLFVKRVLGKGGRGSELWRHAAAGVYRSSHGEERNTESLAAHVAELSLAQPYVIQRAVRNHHDLLDLSAGALCTVRMLSCRNEVGDFEVTCAAFRMSVDSASAVDNFHAGGVAAAVHMSTGRLGPATGLSVGQGKGWHDRHPFTGAQISGRRLPMWRETIDLAQRAHRAFADYAVIGWDIAVLEDGPCIIEGNRGPDVDIHQRTALAPIGDGRFGELLAFNLERRSRP